MEWVAAIPRRLPASRMNVMFHVKQINQSTDVSRETLAKRTHLAVSPSNPAWNARRALRRGSGREVACNAFMLSLSKHQPW